MFPQLFSRSPPPPVTGAGFLASAVVILLGAGACLGLPHSTRDESAVEAETAAA